VSSTAELALGHSPNDSFRMKVVAELVTKLYKLEERLERPVMRIYDLFFGPPLSWA
jgi:hypothetical protein